MAAYADYNDLIAFSDERTVLDLLSDTGDYVGDASADAKLLTLLAAASGQIEAACGVSDLYKPDDLAIMTGNSLALLKQLVAALTMVALVRRRPEKYGSEYWQSVRTETEEYLDRLRKGERLFDDPAKRAAGLPTIDGPTAVGYQNLNLLPSRTRNYFPSVAQRLPLGRG
jgi:hypothetical protein